MDTLIAKGGQTKKDSLTSSYQDLIKKNSAQVAAETIMEQKTKAQDDALKAGHEVISQTQEAAKSAFPNDTVKLKEFRVGTKKPDTAKGTITMLDYLTGVVQKYSTDSSRKRDGSGRNHKCHSGLCGAGGCECSCSEREEAS